MRYRLKMLCFLVHESLKRDNKEENAELKKKVKYRARIKISSLRCCYIFQVIIFGN